MKRYADGLRHRTIGSIAWADEAVKQVEMYSGVEQADFPYTGSHVQWNPIQNAREVFLQINWPVDLKVHPEKENI